MNGAAPARATRLFHGWTAAFFAYVSLYKDRLHSGRKVR